MYAVNVFGQSIRPINLTADGLEGNQVSSIECSNKTNVALKGIGYVGGTSIGQSD